MRSKSSTPTVTRPRQHQSRQPGLESAMKPKPRAQNDAVRGSCRLQGKIAMISGGDSGIGRAVAIAMGKEGADIVVLYLNEHDDAQETKRLVEEAGGKCLTLAGDIGSEAFCKKAVAAAVKKFERIDILVNNAAEQHPRESIADITADQLERTFRTNIFSFFYLTKAALPHMRPGSSIINSSSVTAYRGSPHLLDYASTKGAILGFTRSLSTSLAKQGIRVNAVAPGPIWTPLIPSTFDEEKVSTFGSDVPMQRPGEPAEVAPSYVFLAAADSSYMTGQVLHPNGGEVVNG